MTGLGTVSNWGLVYVAHGAAFVEEAETALRSAREHMPDLPTALFADRAAQADTAFDEVRPTAPDLSMKQQKMHALLHSPFEKTLYLDTDTHLAAPIYEVLEVVNDGFDFAAALSPWYAPGARGSDGRLRAHGVPIAFPKLNAGVMAMAHTPATQDFLQDWFDLHAAWGATGQDQDPLRVALYRSHMRWAPLPPNYNYRTLFPAIANGEIKLLHGRHPAMEALAGHLNRGTGMRGSYPVRSGEGMLPIGQQSAQATPADRLLAKIRRWSRRG